MTTTTSHTSTPSYLPGAVQFDEVAPAQWRVLDASAPASSAGAILGFVARTAGLYEVTSLRKPREIAYYADLDATRAHFVDSL